MGKPRTSKHDQAGAETQLTSDVTVADVTKIVTQKEIENGLPVFSDLPEPSSEIFDAVGESTNGASPTGEVWNADVHESPPRLAARGSWAKKRGGARKGDGRRAERPSTNDDTPVKIEAKIDAAAKLAAGMVFTCGQMLIGPCMAPDSDEREGIVGAFRDYFRAVGGIEVPPWVGLAGAIVIYGARRWNDPQVVEKREKIFGKVDKEKSS